MSTIPCIIAGISNRLTLRSRLQGKNRLKVFMNMVLHAEIFCRINSYKKDMKFLTFCKSLVYIARISPVKKLIFEASEPRTAPDQRRLFGLYAYNIIYIHKLYNIHITYLL